jgi:hypothetical protein
MSFSNTILTDEGSNWLNACSGRLRLIQADAAGLSPEKRMEYLQEEIDRSLKTVPEGDRKSYLEALISRFPVAGQNPQIKIAAPAAETPEQVSERFFAMAAQLSPDKKQALLKQLQAAGLSLAGGSPPTVPISEESRLKLGLAAGQQPQMTHIVELAAFLVEEICLLDKTALKTMRELSARSPLLKRSENFRSHVSRFLANQEGSLDTHWQEIRALLGGLLAAMQGGGKDFGREFVAHLSPTAIEDIIVGEGGSRFLGPNKKERCWDKYLDLAGDYATPDQIDKKIRDCMAVFIERVLVDKR